MLHLKRMLTLLITPTVMVLIGSAPARAFESAAVMFMWNDQLEHRLGEPYDPLSRYRSGTNMGFIRTGVGRYSAIFGLPHSALDYPLVTQVVAYGTDDVKCKFERPSQPIACNGSLGRGTGICTEAFVACFNSAGASQNSRFVVQLAGFPLNGAIPTQRGGFVETSRGGTDLQRNWTETSSGFVRGSKVNALRAANSGSTSALPTVTRYSTGNYRVTFPGLARTQPRGVPQVTAIGNDVTHCKPRPPYAPSSNPNDLVILVHCYAGETAANSDFILDYDAYVTRRRGSSGGTLYQGARAHAQSDAELIYSPALSFNSGSASGAAGTNIARRISTGRYYMEHTTLAHQDSAPFVVATEFNSNYCKLEGWNSFRDGTAVYTRCYNARGQLVDNQYFEAYQGPLIAPD